MPDSLYIAQQDFTFSPVVAETLGWSLVAFVVAAAIFFIVVSIDIFKS